MDSGRRLACLAPPFYLNIDNPAEARYLALYGVVTLYVGFGGILALFVTIPALDSYFIRLVGQRLYGAICRIGFYSYSIYLWHGFFSYIFVDLLKTKLDEGYTPAVLLRFGVYLTLSVGDGNSGGKWVEYPILRYRDRVFPTHRQAPHNFHPLPI